MSLNIHPVIRAVTLGTLGACVCVSAPQPFDYYVFALSWSPEYCASGNSTEQCTGNRRYGFVVHGLWPQYERGGYQANCAGPREVPRAVTDAMLELMPSRELIRHEWRKHGTCSGLSPHEYFNRVRDAYLLVKIPDPLRQPLRRVETSAADVTRAFARANPGYNFAIACRGRFVREVRTCVDRNLRPRPCGRDVRDACPRGNLILRPVR